VSKIDPVSISRRFEPYYYPQVGVGGPIRGKIDGFEWLRNHYQPTLSLKQLRKWAPELLSSSLLIGWGRSQAGQQGEGSGRQLKKADPFVVLVLVG
jgi:hypothetical protein